MAKGKVFISGKVSGMDYQAACRKFYDASASLMRFGFTPVVPVKLCRAHWSWYKCMAVCLWHLLWCKGFCQLDNWEDSRGARIEYRVAKLLGKKFIYL